MSEFVTPACGGRPRDRRRFSGTAAVGLLLTSVFTWGLTERADAAAPLPVPALCAKTSTYSCLAAFGYSATHSGAWSEDYYRYADSGYHNCTRFAAFVMEVFHGIADPGHSFGNAWNWGKTDAEGGDPTRTSLKELGYVVNGTPAVGSIAWFDQDKSADGHVGIVTEVGAGYIVVASDNYKAGGGNSDVTALYPSNAWYPSGFIHVEPAPLPLDGDSFVAGLPGGGYTVAFQANTGNLFTWNSAAGPADRALGMAAGTVPAITALPSGEVVVAFQANTGNLFTWSSIAGTVDRAQGMMPGTSPSIAAVPSGGFMIAFQANTGNLFTYSSVSGAADRSLGMRPSTSPSVRVLPSGEVVIAFQANTGNLFTWSSTAGTVDRAQGMMPGTSPSIAAVPSGGFMIAFQANTGNLFTYSSVSGAADRALGMRLGTSPSVRVLPSGEVVIAFQANTGNLFTWSSIAGTTDRALGMMARTSPAVTVVGGTEIVVAFQANTGNLLTWSNVSGSADRAQGMAPGPAAYVPLVPGRLLESRSGRTTVDGAQNGVGLRTTGSVTEVVVADRGGVPAGAVAAVLNVTAVSPTGGGHLTVWPCGVSQPAASSLNLTAGVTIANGVTAKIGTGGKVCVYTSVATHLLVDVNGYYPSTATLVPLVPARLLESRSGQSTYDGAQNGVGARAAGSVTEVLVAGRGGVPAGTAATILNVTAVSPTGGGYLTVWPCGATKPAASSLNVSAGRTIANGVTAKIGTAGKVCIYTSVATHLLVDVSGYYPTTATLLPLVPARLLESRSGQSTFDGVQNGVGVRTAGSVTEVLVAGRGGVPTGAVAAVLNITAVSPTGGGYLTVWPCGVAQPGASTLNVSAGVTIANGVTAKIGTAGKVCVYTSVGTHLLVDVGGYSA